MSSVRDKYPMVQLVTYIIGLHDPYGVNHSDRVAELCVRMGESLQWPAAALEILELSTLLHDIGKLAIPDATRAKPGPLTEAEIYMMRQHPAMGINILRRMNGNISPRVHRAIYHHHENWSGTGYPGRLKGDAIPLEARIIRIADTYDALTHSRGYRAPLGRNNALSWMVREQERDTLFDPFLFRVFLGMMKEEKGGTLRT